MTAEQTLFLRILADHVHGKMSELDVSSIDEKQFYELIRAQSLLGIFYVQCRGVLPADSWLRKELYAGFEDDVFFAVNRRAALEELSVVFKDAGIDFVPFKGIRVSEYYPVPVLRTMGDVDLVIRTANRQRSDELMKSLGYVSMVDNHAVWTYQKDVVMYEIHDHMMYDPLANDFDYRAYFDRVWDYTMQRNGQICLKPEFHFLYLLAHTAKHIINKGYGIRGFLDLVFFVRGEPDMDWIWIAEELQKLRLLNFAKTCFALCQRWFGVELPLASGELSEEFFRTVTAKIFRDGLWGHDNQENEVGAAARTVRRTEESYWLTACRMTLKKLFPPYRDMQLIPWYGFVDGRPWLLPAAWIYRFWYCLRHKRRHSGELLARPFVKTGEIHAREKMIDSWGL